MDGWGVMWSQRRQTRNTLHRQHHTVPIHTIAVMQADRWGRARTEKGPPANSPQAPEGIVAEGWDEGKASQVNGEASRSGRGRRVQARPVTGGQRRKCGGGWWTGIGVCALCGLWTSGRPENLPARGARGKQCKGNGDDWARVSGRMGHMTKEGEGYRGRLESGNKKRQTATSWGQVCHPPGKKIKPCARMGRKGVPGHRQNGRDRRSGSSGKRSGVGRRGGGGGGM
jgi:hypothetical protein